MATICYILRMKQYFLSTKLFFPMLAIGALLLVGCGDQASSASDGGEIVVETGSLSKADFIQQADEICEAAAAKAAEAGARYGQEREHAPSLQASKAMLKEQLPKFVNNDLSPAFEGAIAEVSSLGAPSGDAKQITAVFTELQAGLDQAKKNPEKFFLGNAAFFKAFELGKAYGFQQCGRVIAE